MIGGRETLRAFLVFGTLFVALSGIAVQLAFHELDLQIRAHRQELGRDEARRIADAVAALGRDRGGIDFSRLRRKQDVLERLINERLSQRSFVRHVEVRDRFGAKLLFVARDPRAGAPLVLSPSLSDPSDALEQITVPITAGSRGAHSEGEVRVGIAQDAFQRELHGLRRSLRLKLTIAAGAGLGVLVLGLLYVMYLIRKNRRLEQSRLAAERRSYVGLLASGLAHEIRNPLNAMNMNLQMLEEELQGIPELDRGDHVEMLDSTKREIKRLEQLVNNFLAYARPSEPRFDTKDLNTVVNEVARFLMADFRQSEVELRLDLEPLLPTVEIDETQFKQALMNLLVNARQVLKKGGVVTVRSRAGAGGEVVLEVQDDGPGIPADVADRIFEVFYSSRGGGTGLGLPIARQIVERHGGTIQLQTRAGQGATFLIRLPRRHSGTRAPAPAARATP